MSRLAVVTGASSGIGEATALRLAREDGLRLVLVARREDRLRAIAEQIGGGATYVAADLTAPDAPARVREHVDGLGEPLGLLVNNAGAGWRAKFADGGYENVRRTMEINFDAVLRLTEALLPLLRAAAPSAIVNVSSTAGRVARGGSGAYSASKFALIGWSDGLHAEEKPNGIHVGMVLPGFVTTELQGHNTNPVVRRATERSREQIGEVLKAEDIAYEIVHAVSRPSHVCVNEVVVRPTGQAR